MTEDEMKAAQQQFVNNLSAQIDGVLNGPPDKRNGEPPKVGFVLLIFPFGEASGATITTNGLNKESLIEVLQANARALASIN